LSLRAQEKPFKVFLVGDAGENPDPGKALLSVQKQLENNPNSAVLFLGDNSYRDILEGIIPGFKGFDSSSLTQKKIRSQLGILRGYKGQVFFTPGNHDWWNRTDYEKGRKKLRMEESFIEANLSENPTIANPGSPFLPMDGSPGPVAVDLDSGRLRIIFIDTYRLIIGSYKSQSVSETPLEQLFYHQLDSLLADSKKNLQRVIIAAHHPLYSKGPNTKPLSHPYLFGRIKASNIHFPSYEKMSLKIRAILRQYPGIYYTSGHTHALLYFFPPDSVHYIISGSGSKNNKVSAEDMQKMGPPEGFEHLLWNNKGYFELDIYPGYERLFLHYNDGADVRELDTFTH
jgi:hypothetical protein